jgi:hypothetical protein
MRPPPAPNDALHRILQRISDSRFFTFSLCLHTIFVLIAGGTVLFHVTSTPPDFEAGAGGMLVEEPDQKKPPSEPTFTTTTDRQFTPAPPVMIIPLSALVTASQVVPTWKMPVLPKPSLRGMTDSVRDTLATLGDRLGKPAPSPGSDGALAGSTGGARWATIFGKKITASRLGVILDVSGSAQPRLAGAVTEIQNGFADATIILYPGCGMVQFDGKPDCEIRKFSSITPQELAANTGYFTTRAQLVKALTIDNFQKMTARPSVKDTLFVAWYGGVGKENTGARLIGQTQVAFDDLIKRGVDAIYWFSDFEDAVDPRVADRLAAQLQSRHIVLHVHNFSGHPVNEEVANLATNSGGTVNLEKTY